MKSSNEALLPTPARVHSVTPVDTTGSRVLFHSSGSSISPPSPSPLSSSTDRMSWGNNSKRDNNRDSSSGTSSSLSSSTDRMRDWGNNRKDATERERNKEISKEKDNGSSNGDGLSFEPGWLNSSRRNLALSLERDKEKEKEKERFPPPKYRYSKDELLSVWKSHSHHNIPSAAAMALLSSSSSLSSSSDAIVSDPNNQNTTPPTTAAGNSAATNNTLYPLVPAEECLAPVNLLPPDQQEEKVPFRRTSVGRGRGTSISSGRGRVVLGEKTLERPLQRSVGEIDTVEKENAGLRSPVKVPTSGTKISEDNDPDLEQNADVPPATEAAADDSPWMYCDPQGNVQGPFTTAEMGGWYDAGYFGPDLMIKRQAQTEFVSLRSMLKKYSGSPFNLPSAKTKSADEHKLSDVDEGENEEGAEDDHLELPDLEPANIVPKKAEFVSHNDHVSNAHPKDNLPASTPATKAAHNLPLSPSVPGTSSVSASENTPPFLSLASHSPVPQASDAHATQKTQPIRVALTDPSPIYTENSLANSGSTPPSAVPVLSEEAFLSERFGLPPTPMQQVSITNQVYQQSAQLSHAQQPFPQMHPLLQHPIPQQLPHSHQLQQAVPQSLPQQSFAPLSPLHRSDGIPQRIVPPGGPPFPHSGFPPDLPHLMYGGWPAHIPPQHLPHNDVQQSLSHKLPAKIPQQPPVYTPHDQFISPPPRPFMDPQQQYILQQQIMQQQQLLQQERNFLQQAQAQAQAQVEAHLVQQEPLRRKSGIFLLDESGMAVQIGSPIDSQNEQPLPPAAIVDSSSPTESTPNSLPLPFKEPPWVHRTEAPSARRISLRDIQEEEMRQQHGASNSLSISVDPLSDKKDSKPSSPLSKSQGNIPNPSSDGFFWDLPANAKHEPLRTSAQMQPQIASNTAITSVQSQADARRASAPTLSPLPHFEQHGAPVSVDPVNPATEVKEGKKKRVKNQEKTLQAQPPQHPSSAQSQQQLQSGWNIPNGSKRLSLQEIQEEELKQQQLQQQQLLQQQQVQQQQLQQQLLDSKKNNDIKRALNLPQHEQAITSDKKVSLREIQEEEIRQQQRRKDGEDLQLQQFAKQQSVMLAQQQTVRWGPSQPPVVDISRPLSLLQIQEEEARKKEKEARKKAMEERKRKEVEDRRIEEEGLADFLWRPPTTGPTSLSAVMEEQLAEHHKQKDNVAKKEKVNQNRKASAELKTNSLLSVQDNLWNIEKPASAQLQAIYDDSKSSKKDDSNKSSSLPKQPVVSKAVTPKVSKKVPLASVAKPSALVKPSEDIYFWDLLPEKSTTPKSEPNVVPRSEEYPALGSKPKQPPQQQSKQSAVPKGGKPVKGTDNKDSKSAFGGPVISDEFMQWCQKELKSLTGNKDTTLAEFLVSLQTPDEVRGYIQEYLGNSAKISGFAAEFLRHREFGVLEKSAVQPSKAGKKVSGPPPQPQQVSVNLKQEKKKKMQKLAPDLLGFTTIPRAVDDVDD